MVKKTDAQIHHDVVEELKWDSRVDETEVGVQVHNGVVTLTGTVTGWAKRVAAQEAAQRVIGVLDVANDLKVNVPGTRTDTDIAHAIRQALEWDVFVPDDKIRSTVSDGWVTLEGSVDRVSQREDAERAVRNLFGVRGISNIIALKDTTPVTEDVRKAIEQTLERRAEREARRIRVDVHDGIVTLTGTVHTWAERKSVLAAVRFTLTLTTGCGSNRFRPRAAVERGAQ
jgi:osmotically-inducible protein OsmY